MIRSQRVVLCFIATMFIAGLTQAGAPNLVSYQGRLTNDAGSPVDTTVDITFYLYPMPGGGDPVWTETHPDVIVADGLFEVMLGAYTTLNYMVFDSGGFMGIQVGDGPVGTPFIPILSVPYALQSWHADTAAYAVNGPWGTGGEGGWTDDGNRVRLTSDTDSVGIGTSLPLAKLHVEGSLYVTSGATFGQGNTNSGYQSLINGEGNTASGNYSAIVGGTSNEVSGDYAMAGSGRNNVIVGDYSAIAGGQGDTVTGFFSFIAGAVNKVSGNFSSVGGGAYNEVAGTYATISGGGPSDPGNPTTTHNKVLDDYGAIAGGGGNVVGSDDADPTSHRFGSIGGGRDNVVGGAYATVGGGINNSAGSYASSISGGEYHGTTGDYAAIGGGYSNQANGNYSTIAGGRGHTADQQYAIVGGGYENNAAGVGSAVLGGLQNNAGGSFSSVGGGASNIVLGDYSAVLGGFGDTIGATADYSYLFGIQSVMNEDSTFMVDMPHIRFGDETTGYEFPTSAGAEGEVLISNASGVLSWTDPTTLEPKWLLSDSVLFTAQKWGLARGDSDNQMLGDSIYTLVNLGVSSVAGSTSPVNEGGAYASITGGKENTASGSYSHIGGGANNTAYGYNATIAGGRNDSAGYTAFVGGGSSNAATGRYAAVGGGTSNRAPGRFCAISGGLNNFAGDDSYDSAAVVSGGWYNFVNEPYGFIGGGQQNKAGRLAALGGGRFNESLGEFSAIVGGYYNEASGYGASIGGGVYDTASGRYSCAPGGTMNTASGLASLAAGNRSKADHDGAVVISANADTLDSGTDEIHSGCAEQFVLRADDNFYLTDGNGVAPCEAGRFLNTSTGGYLSDAGDWTNASDRNAKENFREVDTEALLVKIAELPITEWNYKQDDDRVRHIGPMAQDFQALFGVGADDKSISTIDPAGIALAAIKEISRKTKQIDEQQKEIEDLRSQIEELRSTLETITTK